VGLCGVSAALANAAHNASGARVREYPITLDKVLAAHFPREVDPDPYRRGEGHCGERNCVRHSRATR
jgi:hypothetical protein